MSSIVIEITESIDLVEVLNLGEALLKVLNKSEFKHIVREVKLE